MAVLGEVDIVIGAEFMEAGRAIQRGLVTPDRTTLIASTHRAYAVVEKQTPGDGIGDSNTVVAAAEAAAKRLVAFDMAAAAEKSDTAISAVMFGALAGAGALPFAREAYDATIRSAGISVEASLRGFALGYERAKGPMALPAEAPPTAAPVVATPGKSYAALLARARAALPAQTHEMLAAGMQRIVDFQDTAYGEEYLALLGDILIRDNAS